MLDNDLDRFRGKLQLHSGRSRTGRRVAQVDRLVNLVIATDRAHAEDGPVWELKPSLGQVWVTLRQPALRFQDRRTQALD